MKQTLKALLCILCICLMGMIPAFSEEAEEIDVDLSLESGFYPQPTTLEITCNSNDVSLYYTTNGTAPDSNAIPYEGPIKLVNTYSLPDTLTRITETNTEAYFAPEKDFPSAHVIRAAAVLPDGTVIDTAAGTFFVGYDRQELYGDLPVISLIMDADDLFDYNTGIYVLGATFDEWNAEQEEPYEAWETQGNFSNRGREWERPVVVDFLMPDGESFSQNMGVRIKGGVSRSAPQKSLRLIAREEYGKKNLKYPIFPDNICEEDGTVLEKYKSITLRNGGNDRDVAKIRDPYISRLSDGLELETAGNRPVIGFINGEYWGLYTLNEEYNDNYIQYHYGIDNNNVITMKNNEVEDGEEDDEDLYWEMFDFILENDMADADLYAEACELLDTKSFADYVAVALYIANQDGIFQDNNWQMWRVREPGVDASPLADGKWRMMLFDTDYSSNIYDNYYFNQNSIQELLLGNEYDEYSLAKLAQLLLDNEDYRREFILSLCDVRNLFFDKQRAMNLLNEMTDQYFDQCNETFRRFGPDWVVRWNMDTHLEGKLNGIRYFFDGRYDMFLNHVQEAFELSDSVVITPSCDPQKGCIYVNGRPLPLTEEKNLRYFTEYPITLTASPAEGATFVGWQVSNESGVTLSDATALTCEFTFDTSFAVTAIFE